MPVTNRTFDENVSYLDEYLELLTDNEGVIISVTDLEPLRIFEGDMDNLILEYSFPRFEYQIKYSYDIRSSEAIIQANQNLERLTTYLFLAFGHSIPIRSWTVSKTVRAPVQRGTQPAFLPFINLRNPISQATVNRVYVETFKKTEKLLATLLIGSSIDISIRLFGQSYSTNYKCSFIGLWKSLEILTRSHMPTKRRTIYNRSIKKYLGSLDEDIDIPTLKKWRSLRNDIVHDVI